MIFNPLFFSLMNSKNINDLSNSFPGRESEGGFPNDKISNGFFQKIPKYLFSDIMNVLLTKDEKLILSNEKKNQSEKNIFSSKSEKNNSIVNSDFGNPSLWELFDFDEAQKVVDFHIPSGKVQQNENDVKIKDEIISNKMELIYSFINDLSLQDVFGSKVEEIKSKLKESILTNHSAEILIDKNILKNLIEKLLSNQSNEVKVVLNNDESVDKINTSEDENKNNSLNDKNEISSNSTRLTTSEEKISVNSIQTQEPNLFKPVNSIPLENNFLSLNLIDLLDGGKIVIENNALSNENKLVIEIESSEENNFNSANQFKLKMNVIPNNNFETNEPNISDEVIDYTDYSKTNNLQSNSMKHFSGIDIFPLNEDDNIDYSGNPSLMEKIELVNKDEIVSTDNLISSDEQFDIQNKLMPEKPAKINDYKIEINPLKKNLWKSEITTAIDDFQITKNSSSDFQIKIVLNKSSEKLNSFIQLDKNDLLNALEQINFGKDIETETMISPNENEISNKKINKNNLENIKFIPNEIYDNKIYSSSKYIKNFKSIDDLDSNKLKNEKLDFKNENVLTHLEENKIPLVRLSSLQVKINSSEIKKDEDLSFIDKNSKHQQDSISKTDFEKINFIEKNFENIKKENTNSELNKINVKPGIINEKEEVNYYQNEKNESHNKDNNSTNDSNQDTKNENSENKKIDFNLKENIPTEPHSEKINNQTKTDFISNINSKEILNSEINNFHKVDVNEKFFNSEKIIEISELFKEVSSLISKKENGTVKLQIKPESLGKILITVDATKEIVNARIEVENKAVQTLLENNINQLYSNLNQNGVQLSSVQIFLNQGESKNYRPNYLKKKSYEENNNGLNDDEEKITSRKLGYNTYEYLI